jgi:L-fuconolactonase
MKIDAHQHFWNYTEDAADFTWMSDDLYALKQNFMPDDLAPLMATMGMEGSIAVQAREVVAETDFLLKLAKDHLSIKGVVGWLDLCADDVEASLESYDGNSKLKGFRMLIHDRPDVNFADSQGHLQGVSILKEYGYTYDLLLRTIHLPAAIRLVNKFQNQPFVVDHIAKPAMDGSDWEAWKDGIEKISQYPNVMCKLSGLVTEGDWEDWDASNFVPYLDTVIEAFGADRLMIGSDWPVCTIASGYQPTMGIVTQWIEKLTLTEQSAIMGDTCAQFYSVI